MGKQQQVVPPFPLPVRRRSDHPPTQFPGIHLLLFQDLIHLPHSHCHPLSLQNSPFQPSTTLLHASALLNLDLV